MSFITALFEIVAVVLLGSILFDLSFVESAVMGTVLVAVSPAVIVPSIIHIINKGNGQERRVPQLILEGASMDNIFVIVLFSSFLSLALGNGDSASDFIVLLSLSFLLLELEDILSGLIPFSGLLAIMSMGLTINQSYPELTNRLSAKYNKLWITAQILLFVLVGATVDIGYALNAGATVLLLISFAVIFRMIGVYMSLFPSKLNKKRNDIYDDKLYT